MLLLPRQSHPRFPPGMRRRHVRGPLSCRSLAPTRGCASGFVYTPGPVPYGRRSTSRDRCGLLNAAFSPLSPLDSKKGLRFAWTRTLGNTHTHMHGPQPPEGYALGNRVDGAERSEAEQSTTAARRPLAGPQQRRRRSVPQSRVESRRVAETLRSSSDDADDACRNPVATAAAADGVTT